MTNSNDSSSVYTMRELNLELCTFMKPEKFTGYHKSFISVNGSVNGEKGFILQSPKLILRNSTNSYFEFLISRNKDRQKEFYNIISHLEDSAIVQISQNSGEWFGREIKRDQVETMFRSSIHRPLEINDPYILRISKVGDLDCEVNYPVVCLIKIDGIIFGRNSSTLDMKIVQIKVMKTEQIPSADEFIDHTHQVSVEKPFYNDNASVVPNDFTGKRPAPITTDLPSVVENELEEKSEPPLENLKERQNMIEKIDEVHQYNTELHIEEKQQLQDIIGSEQIIEKVEPVQVVKSIQIAANDIQPIEPPSPVKSVHTVRTQQSIFPEPVSVDAIKAEIMKSIVENDFRRVKELSILLQKHKLGSM